MWRVSSIMSLADLKPVLPVRASVMEAAGVRGTAVHNFAEGHAYGEVDLALPFDEAPPEIDGYTEGIRKFFRDFAVTVLFTERRVVNRRRRTTGRIDLGALIEADPYIIDYKTGGAAPWHSIQANGGYRLLAQEDLELSALARGKLWKAAILYLPGDGNYKWRPCTDQQDNYLFLSALALIQWRHKHGIIDRTDPERPDDDRPPAGG